MSSREKDRGRERPFEKDVVLENSKRREDHVGDSKKDRGRERDKERDSHKRKRDRRSRSRSPPSSASDSDSSSSIQKHKHKKSKHSKKRADRNDRSESRERDKDRKHRKDRSESRDRDGERKHKKDRHPERDRHTSDSQKHSTKEIDKVDADKDGKKSSSSTSSSNTALQAAADDLEEEIRKRRERVRQWQLSKAGLAGNQIDSQGQSLSELPKQSDLSTSDVSNGSVEESTSEMSVAEESERRESVSQPAHEHKHGWHLDDELEGDDSEEEADAAATAGQHDQGSPDAGASVQQSEPPFGHAAYTSNGSNEDYTTAAEMDEEIDPLDEFMNSLHGVDLPPVSTLRPASSQQPKQLKVVNPRPTTGRSQALAAFGSNTITLEEILGGPAKRPTLPDDKADSESNSLNNETGSNVQDDHAIIGPGKGLELGIMGNGWESDASTDTRVQERNSKSKSVDDMDEDDDDFDEEEENARKAFIAALRQAPVNTWSNVHQKGSDPVSTAADTNKVAVNPGAIAAEADVEKSSEKTEEKAEETTAPSQESTEMGRIFAGDGDMIEETEVWAKKRTALEILEESRKAKELKPIDHSTIQYIDFKKNLFIVPRVFANMTEQEKQLKREELQIKVRGNKCPAPVDTWAQCGLSERILSVLQDKLGLLTPFPIQQQAIPAIMCGRDVIGVAKTGSGKTFAFLLPMLRHIQDQPPLKDGEGPIGLIMAPSRELAFQIYNEVKRFTKVLGMRAACIYGGGGVAEQIADLKRGSHIVVCTPGRMIDILCMQAGKMVSLRRTTMVVLDEADRMFDMGFEPQIRMIIQNIRPDRQTVLFSATFPKAIEKLAKSILRAPLEIVVGERSTVNKDITQIVEVHEDEDKFMRLLQLLGLWYERGSVLIFVDKQDHCDQLFHDLLKSGYPCVSLHGGKDQMDRDHVLHEFKTGIKTVMVATSVAGRGLDVPEIVCVVNYNCPNHLEDYVHRVGRTGRAGRKGTAYTFISSDEQQYAHIMIKALEKAYQVQHEEALKNLESDADKLAYQQQQPPFNPPAELVALANEFKDKVERGEAHYHSGAHGFTGTKGFTFDADEQNESQRVSNMQKTAYAIEQGIQPAADDAPDPDDDDTDEFYSTKPTAFTTSIPSLLQSTSAVGGTSVPVGQGNSLVPAANTLGQSQSTPAMSNAAPPAVLAPSPALLLANSNLTPIERAKLIAQQLASNRPAVATGFQPVTAPIVSAGPGGSVDSKASMAMAKLIAFQINSQSNVPTNPDAPAYFADEIEINDFPPQVRKRVTSGKIMNEIKERFGVNVIGKGMYQAPGKTLPLGERPLYLFVEGTNEWEVKGAKLEIEKALESETMSLSAPTMVGAGRYGV